MKIIISLIIFSISVFGSSYKHLEPEELKYIINPKTNKCFKINIDLKTKIINDIENGTIKYVKTTYRFGTIIELSHSGSEEPIIIYTGFGVCKVAEDIIEYGEPKFNIDYYNNLNKKFISEEDWNKMKKTKIIVYHNIIKDKKIFIVVFTGQPLDFDRAKEVIKKYSSLVYSAIPTGINAITFVEKTDETSMHLPTTEEFMLGKLMLMSLPGKRGEISYKELKYLMKLYDIKKAVKFKVKEWYMKTLEHKTSKHLKG